MGKGKRMDLAEAQKYIGYSDEKLISEVDTTERCVTLCLNCEEYQLHIIYDIRPLDIPVGAAHIKVLCVKCGEPDELDVI